MTISTIDESQRKAARVVGFTYLLAMVAAIFEFSVRAHLTASNNGAESLRRQKHKH